MAAKIDTTKARTDAREVNNYTYALERGLQLIQHLPISKRLICELHRILLNGVTASCGCQLTPGEFKPEQNWIGARLIEYARFVLRLPMHTNDYISDLEKYINAQTDDLPLLIKLSLIHYQFRTIHPFQMEIGALGTLSFH